MNDPVRWHDSEGDAPPEVREIFQAAKKTQAMTSAQRSRGASQLAKNLTAPPAHTASLSPLKLLGGLAGTGGAITIIWLALAHGRFDVPLSAGNKRNAENDIRVVITNANGSTPSSPVVPPIAQPNLLTGPVRSPPATPNSTHSYPTASSVPSHKTGPRGKSSPPDSTTAKHSSKHPTSSNQLDKEVRLIKDAQTLLESTPERALSLLKEHADTFPHGQLTSEREFLAVDALLRLGRTAMAQERANALRSSPDSNIYETRLQALFSRRPHSAPYGRF